MKKSMHESRKGDEKYRAIFEYSAVSLWEEDISKLRALLIKLKKGDKFNLRDHAAAHPEFVQEAIRLIEVTDVNEASLRLFEANQKEQLLGPLDIVLDALSLAALGETILAIDEGRIDTESESSAVTLNGRKLSVIVKSHIPPADAAYASMLVSMIDITARKEAEARERRNAIILQSIIESSPDMIYVKDASLRMVLCNSVVSHTIGKEPKETYGKTDIESGWRVELVKGDPEKGMIGWEVNDMAALSGNTIHAMEETSDHQRGTRFFDTTKFPLRNTNGTIIGLVGIGRDVTERKKAEAELRRAKEFAENLIDTANVMVLGLDLEGCVTIFNKAAEEITGYTRAEMMSRSWFETVVPKERYPGVWRKFEKLTHSSDVGSFENAIITKAGEERHISWNNNQIQEGGRVSGTLSFGIDITARRQMEHDLAWERTLFNLLMENLPDFIYFKDSQSRFIRTSVSFARRLGLKHPSEMLGKTDLDFFAADHALMWLEDERNIMKTGAPLFDVEERLAFLDRPDAWDITTKMPLRDSEGTIVGTFGISHDITGRKQLEAKNQELATLVDSADDAIVGIDLSLRVMAWNEGATRLYGYCAEEMIGAEISRLVPPDLEDETRNLGDRLKRGEKISHFETIRLRKDGSRVSISLSLSPIRDKKGKIVGTAAVGGDITEQKANQARINRAQRLEGLATLATGIAHKFNNINTVVGSYLQLIRSGAGISSRLVSYAEAALGAVQKAVEITDRLLVLTDSPGTALEAVRFDALTRTLLPLYEQRVQQSGALLASELKETPPIRSDGSRLKFVVSSIINNALDSLLDRPVRAISVRTGRARDFAYFEVEDSGCGIPEADLPKVFSPFFSAKGEWAPSGSPQAKLGGTGLSLAICNSIVSEYGGSIEVNSTLGSGSTFRVVMPLLR